MNDKVWGAADGAEPVEQIPVRLTKEEERHPARRAERRWREIGERLDAESWIDDAAIHPLDPKKIITDKKCFDVLQSWYHSIDSANSFPTPEQKLHFFEIRAKKIISDYDQEKPKLPYTGSLNGHSPAHKEIRNNDGAQEKPAPAEARKKRTWAQKNTRITSGKGKRGLFWNPVVGNKKLNPAATETIEKMNAAALSGEQWAEVFNKAGFRGAKGDLLSRSSVMGMHYRFHDPNANTPSILAEIIESVAFREALERLQSLADKGLSR